MSPLDVRAIGILEYEISIRNRIAKIRQTKLMICRWCHRLSHNLHFRIHWALNPHLLMFYLHLRYRYDIWGGRVTMTTIWMLSLGNTLQPSPCAFCWSLPPKHVTTCQYEACFTCFGIAVFCGRAKIEHDNFMWCHSQKYSLTKSVHSNFLLQWLVKQMQTPITKISVK